MTFSSHGVEAYYTGVDFAPTNHREKKEMAEKKTNLQFNFSQVFCHPCQSRYPKKNSLLHFRILQIFM